MTRHIAATARDGLSTFLLEMALDKRRMKARLSSVLLEERTKRGRDHRALPQPEMATLLGYSLRQYQRLEDENDPSIPIWEDLTRLLEKLDRDASEIFAAEPDSEPEVVSASADSELLERLGGVERTLAEILRRLPPADSESDPGSAEGPSG